MIGDFVVVSRIVCIMSDELLRCFVFDRHHVLKKFDQLATVLWSTVKEIEAVLRWTNSKCVLEHVVFENNLLQVEERSLVLYFLSDLNDAFPEVLGLHSLAIGTLLTFANY